MCIPYSATTEEQMGRRNFRTKRARKEYMFMHFPPMEGKMYCEACGQSVQEDFWGELVHTYQTQDAHYPVVEAANAVR